MTQAIVDLMTSQGLEMSSGKRLQVRRQLRAALQDGRFFVVERDNSVVGFFVWDRRGDAVFINNLFIVDGARSIKNLLYARKIFRDRFPDVKKFYWKNRKHQREMTFK